MRVAWSVFRDASRATANLLGYHIGSQQMMEALARVPGVEIVSDTEDADAVVWFCHPEIFLDGNLGDGRKHILFTMFEGQPVPKEFEWAFRAAHGVIIPSRFCRSIFETYFKTSGQRNVEIVPLGFNPSIYQYRERSFDWDSGETFKFLWVGAPNARKGWHRLYSTWSLLFGEESRFEVRFKTTHENDPEGYVAKDGNKIYDCRRLPVKELAQIYYDHHCFVFPTSGEGFGLTALEAVATGLPIVTVKYSSIIDFLDDTTAWWTSATWDWAEVLRDLPYYCPHADVIPCGRKMIEVLKRYPFALKKARRAAERAHRGFTWDMAGVKLAEALDRMVKKEVSYHFTPRESIVDDFAAIRTLTENEDRPTNDASALDDSRSSEATYPIPAPDLARGPSA